jgi:D-cysteine desulfhydrase
MIAPPARLELALAPTPILKLDRLSRRLGVELHVKRDDLTGLLESGNKVRKLEFLVGEALQQGADTLLTCGRPDSNGCRAVAAVAARLGLRAVLAIRGERPAAYDGNLLLGRLLGAETRYYSEIELERAP